MIKVYPMNFDDDTALDDATYGRSLQRTEEPAADTAVDQTERHLAVLASLRDIGHDAAVVLKNRVVYAAAEGKTDDKAAKCLALVIKTVEQVIMLHTEISGLREKRRAGLVRERKAKAKQIVRGVIDRADVPDASGRPRTEKVRAVQRVRLETAFETLDDDLVAGLSVAEIVARACRLFGLNPGPLAPWPEWAELRPETPPEPAAEPAIRPPKAKPSIPARLSGASALGLNGRAPPDLAFAQRRERAPP